MKVKISRNAAKVLKKVIEEKAEEGQMIRVVMTHRHVDHVHYALAIDFPNEHDEIVETDKEIKILLDSREDLLDGVWIQYFYSPKEGFNLSNPSKGNHGDH